MKPNALYLAPAVFTICASVSAQNAQTRDPLADMRSALGGDAVLSRIGSFSVAGAFVRRVEDDRSITQELLIECVLPDKFLTTKTQRSPFDVVMYYNGFSGADPIQRVVGPKLPAPVITVGAQTPERIAEARRNSAKRHKQEFSRFAIALFGRSFDSYPLTLTYAGLEQIDGRNADLVDAKAADGFTFRLYVDAMTHLPVMITWKALPDVMMAVSSTVLTRKGQVVDVSPAVPAPLVKPPPGGVAITGPPTSNPTAGLALVERRLVFDEFKTEGGLTWPHRVREFVEREVVIEMRLGTFRINPTLDSSRFATVR